MMMDELLEVHDLYQMGKVNLDEAISLAQEHIDLSSDKIKNVFLQIERENVIYHDFSKSHKENMVEPH